MKGWWNARQPGQRTWVGRRERCEAPVQHGRHIISGSKVASAGGYQQVAERMFTGFGREGEQVGSEAGPGGISGESGNVLVGLVELCDRLGSEELFGCHMKAVGVTPDGRTQPGSRVAPFFQQSGG